MSDPLDNWGESVKQAARVHVGSDPYYARLLHLKGELKARGCEHNAGWMDNTIFHEHCWTEDPYKDDLNWRDGLDACFRITMTWHLATCEKLSREEAKKKLEGVVFKQVDYYGHVAPKRPEGREPLWYEGRKPLWYTAPWTWKLLEDAMKDGTPFTITVD